MYQICIRYFTYLLQSYKNYLTFANRKAINVYKNAVFVEIAVNYAPDCPLKVINHR